MLTYGWAALAVVVCTALDALLYGRIAEANLIMIYLLGVLPVALRGERGAAIAAGLGSVVAYDLFFVPPFHMYRQLKQSYELGRFSAIMRTMALLTFCFIAAALFIASAVAIGAA